MHASFGLVANLRFTGTWAARQALHRLSNFSASTVRDLKMCVHSGIGAYFHNFGIMAAFGESFVIPI